AASGIAALAVERGGHVRVGLEDHHAPPRLARNEELVAEVAALCRAAGRPPATVEEAASILFG
ncbi:MAG TPA: 3-keto-5-aminohexanoate cleavage protein, partial [Acidimicrobiia bacterium]|nr:3-keto-5-aminohexanoate cleavage protein [Acidimicrobiia bacterium]